MNCLETRAYINGEFVDAQGGTFAVTNPVDNSLLANVADCKAQDVNKAIASAAAAYKKWSKLSVLQRNSFLKKMSAILRQNTQFISTSLTKENGKIIGDAIYEVGMCADAFEWYSEEARRLYGDVIPSNSSSKRYITLRQPVGVVALILAWNYPLILLGRKVAPALAAGCTVVLKPAEDTPLNALLFARVCAEANLPPGVVNILPCSRPNAPEIGAAMADSKVVRGLSFTGSTATGQWLYARCAPTMKRMGMELGGNGPFIVFASADMDAAVAGLLGIKFANSGQICICANRIYIEESIFDQFLQKFSQAVATMKLGNGLEPGVNMGPIINKAQLQKITRLVKDAVDNGAKVVRGGEVVNQTFFEPTILTGINRSMQMFTEEIFGPVAAFQKFKTEEEVIELANETQMGLAGYFYSSNMGQIWRVAEALEVGMVGANTTQVSEVETPFGGVKWSGLGREGGREAIDEYTETKLIAIGNL